MSLSAHLTNPPAPPVHGFPCSMGSLLVELPSDEAAAVHRMLWELNWTDPQTYTALAEEGHAVGLQQIGKHRRKQCRCFKAAA